MNTAFWLATWRGHVHTDEDMVRFVDAVGCCAINPLPRFPHFPSVGAAMERDDALWPAWFWKDDLHIQRRLYYTRLFAGKPGFIANDLLPAFIAANGAVIDELVLLGQVPPTTVALYRLIEEHGPISTRRLKQLLTPDARKAATRELWELERRFMITKTDITGRELASYSYVWDLAERWVPEAFTAADRLRKSAVTLITHRLQTLGVELDPRLTASVLRWTGG